MTVQKGSEGAQAAWLPGATLMEDVMHDSVPTVSFSQ